jgi:pyruvate dehydrogenase E2 component (dihydrolipoamide acetyltransferase)
MIETVVRYKRLDGVTEALEKIAASSLVEPAPLEVSPILKTQTNRLLVVRGLHDNILSAGEMPAGASLQTLEHSGHMPHMEESGRVNGLLLEHFAKADRADMDVR